MQLLAVTETEAGALRVSLGHAGGVTTVEGSVEEVRALADAMAEVAVLATAADDDEEAWIHEVLVGAQTVRIGILPGQRTRLRVAPAPH